jgi:sulfite oxidase
MRISRRVFLGAAAVGAAAALKARAQQRAPEGTELIVRQEQPLNAEPALADLVAEALTPVKHFYIRSHGSVPVAADGFKVRIEGLVNKPLELTLGEIRERFKSQTTEAALTCAGNRREEISKIKPVAGVQWSAGAIGQARWTGAPLADVLRAAELKPEASHVWFDGLDQIKEKDGSQAPFGGSIPLEKALAADAKALVAHAMNEAPLTAAHGAPLRTIVPGYIGARSVKWLAKITLSDRPSPNHYVAEAYKLIQTEDEAKAAEPIYAFPINAAICSPAAGATLKAGRTTVAGYALPAGVPGCTITTVELSTDGGASWKPARLQEGARAFSWQLWSADVDLPAGKHELLVRATDSRGHTMPKQGNWNLKGYLYNGWHGVAVENV